MMTMQLTSFEELRTQQCKHSVGKKKTFMDFWERILSHSFIMICNIRCTRTQCTIHQDRQLFPSHASSYQPQLTWCFLTIKSIFSVKSLKKNRDILPVQKREGEKCQDRQDLPYGAPSHGVSSVEIPKSESESESESETGIFFITVMVTVTVTVGAYFTYKGLCSNQQPQKKNCPCWDRRWYQSEIIIAHSCLLQEKPGFSDRPGRNRIG